jgi:hypothetical protein
MGITEEIKQSWEDLDQPVDIESSSSWLKKGKIRIIIISEDKSYNEYYKKFGQSYFFMIKKRRYLIIPSCILRGKNNTLVYYFNNPFPVNFIYENTQMTALDLYDKDMKKLLPEDIKLSLANTMIDGEVLRAAFDSNFLQNMYYQKKLSFKVIIIIVIVVFIIILIILQITGVVDVIGMLTGGGAA